MSNFVENVYFGILHSLWKCKLILRFWFAFKAQFISFDSHFILLCKNIASKIQYKNSKSMKTSELNHFHETFWFVRIFRNKNYSFDLFQTWSMQILILTFCTNITVLLINIIPYTVISLHSIKYCVEIDVNKILQNGQNQESNYLLMWNNERKTSVVKSECKINENKQKYTSVVRSSNLFGWKSRKRERESERNRV